MYEYVGVIHIHSVFSDGTGQPEEIAGYANEVNLDYIILTDHNTLRPLSEGYEKFYENTLLLVGCELNDRNNQNHYLAMGIEETYTTRMNANEYVAKVKEAGGIGFIAHPFEKRSSMKEHPPYPWTDWTTKEFTGIEIWNHMSEWMEGLTEQNKYTSIVHPLRTIKAPNSEALKKWDELSLERKIVAIGGADAHAHKLSILGFFDLEVFPYKVLFKAIRTHIITDKKLDKRSVNKSKALVYEALESGSCFISNYYHGDASGFRFFAESEKKIYQMGDSLRLSDNTIFRVILPIDSGKIKLIRNGKVIDTVENSDVEFRIKKNGIYRVEVYNNDNAWIFSNHIRVEN